MVSLNSAEVDWDTLRNSDNVETIPKPKQFYESHIFNCVRYDVPADKGFTDNLNNFLLEIINSEKVNDDDIKTVAKALMNNCIDHQIIKYTDEQIKEIQDKYNKI
jgi:hypothetical protein